MVCSQGRTTVRPAGGCCRLPGLDVSWADLAVPTVAAPPAPAPSWPLQGVFTMLLKKIYKRQK